MLTRFAAVASLVAAVARAARRRRAASRSTGGNGTLYIGGWPNKIFVIDEATEKITRHASTSCPARRRS